MNVRPYTKPDDEYLRGSGGVFSNNLDDSKYIEPKLKRSLLVTDYEQERIEQFSLSLPMPNIFNRELKKPISLYCKINFIER